VRFLASVIVLLAVAAPVVEAQIVPTRPAPQRQRPDPADTIPVPPFRVEPPVSPVVAALRSLLLPGWGQSVVGRRATGAVFIFWEGLTLTMTVKSVRQLHYLESIDTDTETLEGKRAEVKDWAVLLVFNHLLAAAEAYVATHLWDFPVDLTTETLPSGDVGAGFRVYW
jgi:hypothetical protein